MKKNRKIAILLILTVVAIMVWLPKGKRERQKTPLYPGPVSSEKEAVEIMPGQRKRTAFAHWGRNPFVWSKEAASPVSGLTLSGIIWDNQVSYAIINGEVVHIGEEIAGHIVKYIEPDKVILTDGAKDYILELK